MKRLYSLDALRGFDMFFIMGGSEMLAALAHWYPCPLTAELSRQMSHSPWHGFTHYDTIFPLFIFIAGISFPFSLAKQKAQGKSMWSIHRKIIMRGVLLVLLGILYNGMLSNFDFANLRYASVLGRIGLSWMTAALIYVHMPKTTPRAVLTAVLLLGYWILLRYVPAPDAAPGSDIFSSEGTIVGYIDRAYLPGRIHYGNIDPEGILSTVPAVCTAMLGMFTGEWVKHPSVTSRRKAAYMLMAAVVLLIVALLWGQVFPINKKMWTSTFVLASASYSLFMFTLFYYLIDIRQWRHWAYPLRVIGLNSITIYLAQRFIDFSFTADRLFGGAIALLPRPSHEFFKWAAYVVSCWLFLLVLHHWRKYMKIY